MKKMSSVFPYLLCVFSILAGQHASGEPNCSNSYDTTFYYDFKTACFKHDACYSEAGLYGRTKSDCDTRFLTAMMAKCGPGVLQSWCRMAATIYFTSVKTQFDDRFKTLYTRSSGWLKDIKARGDKAALATLSQRRTQQARWLAMASTCATIRSGDSYLDCMRNLSAVAVVDSPEPYHMGGCNTLGRNWTNGHRTANAIMISKELGYKVTVDDLRKHDPCVP